MIAVAEADAVGLLDQFDAVEDSAPDVGGALEGIAARSGDDERLLSGLQPARQTVVAVVAEQTAADRRHRDIGDVKIDEGVVRIAFLRMRRRGGIARLFESLVHVRDRKEQSADRTVADQTLPIADLAFRRIDGLRTLAAPRRRQRHPWSPSRPLLISFVAERTMLSPMTRTVTVAPLTMSTCGAGAAPLRDRRHVGADQLVDGFQNALLGNAHQNDGFLVFDELQAGQHALRIDADQKSDRLAGIAGRVGEVGIQVDETLQLFAAIDRNDGRLALRRTEAVGSGKEIGRRGLRQIRSEVAGGQGALRA